MNKVIFLTLLLLGVCISHAQTTISYAQTTYCQNEVDPTPTITGTTGGVFSSTSGLSINTNTGVVDLSASTAGNYTINYNFSTGNASTNLTVSPTDNASFTYNTTLFCTNDPNPIPTITGDLGGTFVSAPFGLVINAATGEVNPGASLPGNYTIRYTTPAPCASFATVSVIVEAPPTYSFFYRQDTYCTNAPTNPDPVISPPIFGGGITVDPPTSEIFPLGRINLPAIQPGTYAVTYFSATTSPNGCVARITDTVTIVQGDDPAFNYGALNFCTNGPNVTPIVINTNGGTFSARSGLDIDPNTGTVNFSNSTPGNYTVTYTTAGRCPSTLTQAITVDPAPNASFSYPNNNYCIGDNDPIPTITGLSGGQFSSSTGLSINASTGLINLNNSTAGTYQVVYSVSNGCVGRDTALIVVNTKDDASFSYPSTFVCQNAVNPLPVLAGTIGGQFSSTGSLALNNTTGEIDLTASLIGTYSIVYQTNGVCPDTETATLTIEAIDDANFSYPSTICQILGTVGATLTGTPGGQFVSTTGLSINTNTGIIDAASSTPNSYTVSYTTSGNCPDSSTQTVTILPLEDASFSYPKAIYCQNEPSAIPTITTTGGTFISSPAGLAYNVNAGVVDIGLSIPRTYVVSHITSGACPDTATQSISIIGVGSAAFAYDKTTYCAGEANPNPTITGTVGGQFSGSSGLAVNSLSGQIDLTTTPLGTYTVTYIVTNSTCADTNSVGVNIAFADTASFPYTDTFVCVNGGNNLLLGATGSTTGTYSASPAGVAFVNTNTGEIDVPNTTAGTYVVRYITTGVCPDTASINLTATFCLGVDQLLGTAVYQVYPNPNAGSFYISHQGEEQEVHLKVVDVLGRRVYEESGVIFYNNNHFLQLPPVAAGAYWLVLESPQGIWHQKIVVAQP